MKFHRFAAGDLGPWAGRRVPDRRWTSPLSRTPPRRAFLWMNEAFFSESEDACPANASLVPSDHLPRAAWHKNDGRHASDGRHD